MDLCNLRLSMITKFTEQQTRRFYNSDDTLYRSFWDNNGNCHWGYFPSDSTSFSQAMKELNKKMLDLAQINTTSTVLDLGCGNGINSFFIEKNCACRVTGLDLSDARINNAQEARARCDSNTKKNVRFFQGSATKLPFKDRSFSHVWSQSTIYHIHNKEKALKEIARVLKNDGVFIFDDLIKPNKTVSKGAKKYIYDRLLFNTDFTLVSYQQELVRHGFRMLFAEDLSRHLAMSYEKLADKTEGMIRSNHNKEFHAEYRKLIRAYRETSKLTAKGDVGWALFLAKKV